MPGDPGGHMVLFKNVNGASFQLHGWSQVGRQAETLQPPAQMQAKSAAGFTHGNRQSCSSSLSVAAELQGSSFGEAPRTTVSGRSPKPNLCPSLGGANPSLSSP